MYVRNKQFPSTINLKSNVDFQHLLSLREQTMSKGSSISTYKYKLKTDYHTLTNCSRLLGVEFKVVKKLVTERVNEIRTKQETKKKRIFYFYNIEDIAKMLEEYDEL